MTSATRLLRKRISNVPMCPVSWRAATVIRTNEAMEAIIQPVARRAGRPAASGVGLKGPV